MKIVLNINKTVEQNAVPYFELAKKAKRKIEGAKKAIAKFESELARQQEKIIERKGIDKIQETPGHQSKRALLWFEKFRWFITSTGFLVIGGRDAQTNEAIIKRYANSNDLVFHTDMAGSPFFVVKADSNLSHPELMHDEKTLREVADATCSFSRAWKLGLSSSSVFYVTPDQVTKQANSGEFLATGSFVIKGKTNYIDNTINIACGVIDNGEYKGLLMCAPLECIQKYCENYVTLKQGTSKPSDVARMIKKQFGQFGITSIDQIIKVLPAESIELIKQRPRTKR